MDDSRLLCTLLQETVDTGVEARFEVHGRSMLPLVCSGDVVRLRRIGKREPRLGDVVAVRTRSPSGLLVHRVVRTDNARCMVIGDNTTTRCVDFSRDDIVGIVAEVERNGRSVWFGSGRFGPLVAFAVRHGLIWRVNRVVYGVCRRVEACLKFLGLTSRLREHKGVDGNE